MTALTASLALRPLALGGGKPGNEIQAPIAMVILFGLLSSTFLNMVVLPTVYYASGGRLESDEDQVRRAKCVSRIGSHIGERRELFLVKPCPVQWAFKRRR